MERKKKRLVLDTNVIRYLHYNENVNKNSRDFLNSRLQDIFFRMDEIYLPKIVQIELEFQLKKDDRKKGLDEIVSKFKTIDINERTFYILKTIDELIKQTKTTKKYKLSDFLILSSIIAKFVDNIGFVDGEISFITADLNDFEKGLLDNIFENVKYENVCYVLQEEKFLDTKKYNAINLFMISFNKLNNKFLSIGEDLWWEIPF